jgi:hypothetical protein
MKLQGSIFQKMVTSVFATGGKVASKKQCKVGVLITGVSSGLATPVAPDILQRPTAAACSLVTAMDERYRPMHQSTEPLSQFRAERMREAAALDLSQVKVSTECHLPMLRQGTTLQLLRNKRMQQVQQVQQADLGAFAFPHPSHGLRRGVLTDSRRVHARQVEVSSSVRVLTADLLSKSDGKLGDILFGHAAWKISQVQDALSQGKKLNKTTIEQIRHQSQERCGLPCMGPIASFLANLASSCKLSPNQYIPKEIKGKVADEVYETLRLSQPIQLAQIHPGSEPVPLTLPSLAELEKKVKEVFDELVPTPA